MAIMQKIPILNRFVGSAKPALRAYFFCQDHNIEFGDFARDIKKPTTFTYEKGIYIIDFRASRFQTPQKLPVFFYIKGIPNPLNFDFNKYIDRYIENKRENPGKLTFDDHNNLVEVSFSSESLALFTQDTFLQHLLAKMSPEHWKLVFALIGAVVIAFVVILVIILVK